MVHMGHCGLQRSNTDTKIQCYVYDGSGIGVLWEHLRGTSNLDPSVKEGFTEKRHLS